MNAIDLRVGIDLCSTEDVAVAIANFGDRYLNRVFTDAELGVCTIDGRHALERLAARFAAKEATMKGLRPNGDGLDLRNIEITIQPGGWTAINLSGGAEALAQQAGIQSLALSITHERGMAAAVVVAQAEQNPRSRRATDEH